MNILSIEAINLGPFESVKYDMPSDSKILSIQGINNEEGSNKESNGSGKSFFFVDIPEWILFGRLKGEWDNNIRNDEIIRVLDDDERADSGTGTLIFELNDEIYKVERSIKNGGAQSLRFLQKVGDDWISHTKSADINKNTGKRINSIANTQRKINLTLGCNDKLFINSICFEQDNINAFAKSNKNEREDLLGIAINKEKWIAYSQKCKVMRDEVKTSMSNHKYFLDQYNVDNLKSEISEEKFRLKETEVHLKDKEVELSRFKELLKFNNEKLSDLKNKKEQISDLMSTYTKLKREVLDSEKLYADQTSKIKREKAYVENIDIDIDKSQDDLVELFIKYDEYVDSIKDIDKNEFEEEIEKVKSKIEDVRNDIEDIKTKIRIIDIDIANNQRVYCPGTTILCSNADNDAIDKTQKSLKHDKFMLQRKLNNSNKLATSLSKEYAELKQNFELYNDIVSNIISLEKKISNIDDKATMDANASKNLENIIVRMTDIAEERNSRLKELKNTLVETERKIEQYQDIIDKLNAIDDLVETITEITNRIDNIETSVPVIKENIYFLKSKIKNHEDQIEKCREHEEKLVELDEEYRILEFSYKMYGKAIPHLLLTRAVPEIEYYAKEYIERISKGRMDIDFVTQETLRSKDADKNFKTRDTFDIIVTLDNKKYSYALFSGGEKTRVDIAIHLAYSMYLINRSGAKLETLFLDEVTGQMDKEGRELLIELLKELIAKGYFKKIFVISHDDEIKYLIDDQVLVRKTDSGSIVYDPKANIK